MRVYQTKAGFIQQGNYQQNKSPPPKWGECANDTYDKRLISKIHKELTELSIKKKNKKQKMI